MALHGIQFKASKSPLRSIAKLPPAISSEAHFARNARSWKQGKKKPPASVTLYGKKG